MRLPKRLRQALLRWCDKQLYFDRAESVRNEFERIMDIAADIGDANPQALRDYIAWLGRKVHGDLLYQVLGRQASGVRSNADIYRDKYLPSRVWFSPLLPLTADGRTLVDLWIKLEAPVELDLARDTLWPWPWKKDSVVDVLTTHGQANQNEFVFDPDHHVIFVWEPFGIAWVHNGNHSLSSAMIHREGRARARDHIDLSPVFEHVYCDGVAFIRTFDQKPVGLVYDAPSAAIFEIGRLIAEYQTNAGTQA